ncbi:MAG TPA: hypothetical protein VFQ70_02480 [Candidatus Saccharimonadaceae bacterium]|nr:hypothetical protein [Candidatus Saccharimonadaceae bacterium]
MTRTELDEFFALLGPGDDHGDQTWAPSVEVLQTPGEYLLEYEGEAVRLTVSESGAEAVVLASGKDFPPLKAVFEGIPIDESRAQRLVHWAKKR